MQINKLRSFFLLLAATLCFLFAAKSALAATDTMDIGTATAREDTTALGLSEIKGHNRYCGRNLGDYQESMFFPGATLPATTIVMGDLTDGIWFCVFTTLDINNRESTYSATTEVVVDDKALPNSPDNTVKKLQIIRTKSTQGTP